MLNHKGTQEIYTERLILRKYRLSDAKWMFKNYANDERVTRFLSWEPYENCEDVEQFLQSVIGEYQNENVYQWAIEYNGEMIGSISLYAINELWKNCEVGYCLGYHYWNKGITSEAFAAVIGFAFHEVGFHRIMGKHDEQNPASGEVMKKCGMKYEGRMKEYYIHKDGTYSDSLLYGIVNTA